MAQSTKLVVRGHTIRTQSHFRYQIIAILSPEWAAKTRTGKEAVIVGRSNTLAVAIKRAAAYLEKDDRAVVVVDRETGEELYSFPKLETTVPASLEEQVQEEEAAYQEEQQFVEPEDTSGSNIDPAALFLTEMIYPNMFEARGVAGGTWQQTLPYCKVCGEMVPVARQEAHHAGHKRDRSHYNTERIRARKEQTDMAKPKTASPAEQGVPAVYLNADGTKFIPGRDASLKRDLIASIDSLDNPNGLHTFDPAEAAKILSARGWNDFLVKSRKNRETKAARDKAKAEAKAAKVKDEVAAKRKAKAKASVEEAAAKIAGGDEVKPDPKPERKTRAGGRRKVGA